MSLKVQHNPCSAGSKAKQAGFTLVEIAFVLILTGAIITIVISSFLSWQNQLRRAQTEANISIISDAIAAYASRNYRVPCPADPQNAGPEEFGYDAHSFDNSNPANPASGVALPDAINNCNNLAITRGTEGIVPFKSLGISAEVIRDGWGNYFTYQVDPSFTADPENPATLVHARCRTTDWIEGTVLNATPSLVGGRNLAPLKARFCCRSTGGNAISIFSTAANAPANIYQPDAAGFYQTTETLVDPYDTTDPASSGVAQSFYGPNIYGGTAAVTGLTDMPVYALISHGENGLGAYVGNGTANRVPGAVAQEAVNANTAHQYVFDLPHNTTAGATYFDDIVSWQTQTDLLARLRRDSCVLP